jgi:hypothetical protein
MISGSLSDCDRRAALRLTPAEVSTPKDVGKAAFYLEALDLYSYRNDAIGSVRSARLAGRQDEIPAARISKATTANNNPGSLAETP